MRMRLRPLSRFWKFGCCCWGWTSSEFVRGYPESAIAITWSRHLRFVPHFRKTTRAAVEAMPYEEVAPDSPKVRGWAGLWHTLTARWSVWRESNSKRPE